MAEIDVKNWSNKSVRKLELDTERVRLPAEEAPDLRGRAGLSGGGPQRYAQDQEPQRDLRRYPEAVEAEGHTGRARIGDNRSPLWRHGGTVHGPQPRDYSWDMPKKMRRNALRSALAQKLRDGELVCLEDFDV